LLIGLALCGQYLPAAVVTNGFINLGGSPRTFEFSGDGFHLTGAYDFLSTWVALVPGGVGTVGASGSDLRGGSATVGGVHYPSINWNGWILAHADVPIPPGPPMSVHTFTGPFTFTGALCGVIGPIFGENGPAPCEFEFPSLTGSGIATITGIYVGEGEDDDPTTSDMRFDVFMNESRLEFTAIPEPAAGVLALFGLALLVVGRRRRSA
jgi:MYXO-CTERM domain-containing protein